MNTSSIFFWKSGAICGQRNRKCYRRLIGFCLYPRMKNFFLRLAGGSTFSFCWMIWKSRSCIKRRKKAWKIFWVKVQMLTLLRCVIILGNPKFDFSIFFLYLLYKFQIYWLILWQFGSYDTTHSNKAQHTGSYHEKAIIQFLYYWELWFWQHGAWTSSPSR